MNWIGFTIFAATMQSLRTAGQKKMGSTFSPLGNTFVRFGFGLPFAALYFGFLLNLFSDSTLGLSISFFVYVAVASLCQILGTMSQVRLLAIRDFASGTVFVKTDVMLTALIGFSFFDDVLGAQSWVGISACSIGIFILSRPKGVEKGFQVFPALMGVTAGLGFALASLFIRKASLSLTSSPTLSAATCLVVALTIQTVVLSLYLSIFEPRQWKVITSSTYQASFIGLTSVAGSVGWYTAMTLTQASFVRALGQVEVIIALFITYIFFREKPTLNEWVGIITVTAGVLLTIS